MRPNCKTLFAAGGGVVGRINIRFCLVNMEKNLLKKKRGAASRVEDAKLDVDAWVVLNYDRTDAKDLTVKFGPPSNWTEVYEEIRNYREHNEAPVDKLGFSTLVKGDGSAVERERRFQVLVCLLLSSRTKDEMTARAMQKLLSYGLTVQNIINSDIATIVELISDVGFKNKKADYIIRVSKILHEEYQDDIPRDIDGMMRLPGIGPKMAYLIAAEAWGMVSGIGVDTHVHRISNRLGWAYSNHPEYTRLQLESWLPKRYWSDVNTLLVDCVHVGKAQMFHVSGESIVSICQVVY